MASTEYYRGVVERISGLPTLPSIINKITEQMRDPKTVAKDIGKAISEDQALAAKVLKLVNSAYYGFPRKINTITQAVVILGFSALRNIVLTASIVNLFPADKAKEVQFSRDDFWTHSIAVGIAAKVIARRIGVNDVDNAFMAGLLHDIGKLIIDQFIHQDFEKVIRYVKEKDCLFIDAENSVIKTNHAQVGGWLGEKWRLPESLVEVIARHHEPVYAKGNFKTAAIVSLADIVVRALDIGSGGDNKIPRIDDNVWNELGISMNMLEKIMKEISEELEKSSSFISDIKGGS